MQLNPTIVTPRDFMQLHRLLQINTPHVLQLNSMQLRQINAPHATQWISSNAIHWNPLNQMQLQHLFDAPDTPDAC